MTTATLTPPAMQAPGFDDLWRERQQLEAALLRRHQGQASLSDRAAIDASGLTDHEAKLEGERLAAAAKAKSQAGTADDRCAAVQARDSAQAALVKKGPAADAKIAAAMQALADARAAKQALVDAADQTFDAVELRNAAVCRLRGRVPEYVVHAAWAGVRDVMRMPGVEVQTIAASIKARLPAARLMHFSNDPGLVRNLYDMAREDSRHWAHQRLRDMQPSAQSWATFQSSVEAELQQLLNELDAADADAGQKMRDAIALFDLYVPQ